jgi:hypothetical protein
VLVGLGSIPIVLRRGTSYLSTSASSVGARDIVVRDDSRT